MTAGAHMPIEQDQLVRTLIAERVKILAYIRAIVRREDLAEDVFQNVSILAVRRQAEIVDEEHFLKWLRRTARFEAMNLVRKTGTHERMLDQAVLESLEDHWARRDTLADSETAGALEECLKRLSPDKLRIIRERYGSGRSVGEVAAVLGRRVNSLYVAISRIHRLLADCVRRRLGDRGVDYG